jgi:hypothetical protein
MGTPAAVRAPSSCTTRALLCSSCLRRYLLRVSSIGIGITKRR